MAVKIEVINTLDSLRAIEAEWKSLEARIHSRFYHKFDYYYAYYSFLQEAEATPNIIVMRSGDTVIAIFPWEKRHLRSIVGLKVYQLSSVLHRHLYLNDILFDNNYFTEIATAFSDFWGSLPWNTFFRTNAELETGGLIRLLSEIPDLALLKEDRSRSFYLKVDNAATESRVPKKMLRNLKRLLRKVENETNSKAEFEFLSGGELTDAVFKCFLDIEGSGWKGPAGESSAIILDSKLTAFYGHIYKALPDCIQISLFKLEGEPIAAQFCLKDDNCLALLKIGYLEKFHNYSPGHALIYQALLHLMDDVEQCEINFVAAAPWLSNWAPDVRVVSRIHFAKSHFGKVWVGILTFAAWMKPYLQRIKRFLLSKFK